MNSNNTKIHKNSSGNKKIKILFVHIQENKSENSTRYGGFSKRLKRLGDFDNYIFDYSALEKLVFISNKKGMEIVDIYKKHKLSDYDLVYIRDWGRYTDRVSAIAHYCKIKGIQFIDQAVANLGTQKLSTHFKLLQDQLNLVDSIFARVNDLKEYTKSSDFSDKVQYPLILKSSTGQKGNNNFLIKDYQALISQLSQLEGDGEFILQPYIKNNGDYRVLCMGHEPKLVIHRKALSGHLNNVSKGGQATLIPILDCDPMILDMAIEASKILQLDICGVDIIYDDESGKYSILEVNSTGALVTASFVDQKMKALKDYFDYNIGRVIETRKSKIGSKKLRTIGRHVFVALPDLELQNIPAKIDTGAYRSSIHADNIKELVVGGSKILTFEVNINGNKVQKSTSNYRMSEVGNSIGKESRYYIKSKIKLGNITLKTDLYLTHRGSMAFPLLIGRKLLNNRFLVNPAIGVDKDKRSWKI